MHWMKWRAMDPACIARHVTGCHQETRCQKRVDDMAGNVCKPLPSSHSSTASSLMTPSPHTLATTWHPITQVHTAPTPTPLMPHAPRPGHALGPGCRGAS